MDTLSTGQRNTLQSHYENCLQAFGEDSEATKWLKTLIGVHGADVTLVVDERTMVRACMILDAGLGIKNSVSALDGSEEVQND